jgi:hypothetical protein
VGKIPTFTKFFTHENKKKMARELCHHSDLPKSGFGLANHEKVCSAFAVAPPESMQVLFPLCVSHLSDADSQKYQKEVEELTKNHVEVHCPICITTLKDIHVEKIFKIDCCKNFICKTCFRQYIVKKKVCPICQKDCVVGTNTAQFINHANDFSKKTKKIKQKFIQRTASEELLEMTKKQLERASKVFLEGYKLKIEKLQKLSDVEKITRGLKSIEKVVTEEIESTSEGLFQPFVLSDSLPRIPAFI